MLSINSSYSIAYNPDDLIEDTGVKKKTKPGIELEKALKVSKNKFIFKTYEKYLRDLDRSNKLKYMRGKVGKVVVRGAENLNGIEILSMRTDYIYERHKHVAVLSDENEFELIREIIHRLECNNPMTGLEIRQAAKNYSEQNITHRQFEKELPSNNWLFYFKRKYKPIFFGDLFEIELEFIDETDQEVFVDVYDSSIQVTCRFCMNQFDSSEKIPIPFDFYLTYEKMTGKQLQSGSQYPKNLCKKCHEKFLNMLDFLQMIDSTQKELKNKAEGSSFILVEELNEIPDKKFEIINENEEDEVVVEYLEDEEIECVLPSNNPSVMDHDYMVDFDTYGQVNISTKVKDDTTESKTKIETLLEDMGLKVDDDHVGDDSSLNIHPTIKNFIEKENAKFHCDLCGRTTKTKHGLRCHIYKEHLKLESYNREEFPCKNCGEVFTSYWKHFDHRHKVHMAGEFECPSCDQIFNDRLKLRRHQLKYHVPKKMCEFCGGYFAPSQMGKHISAAHKTSTCSACGKVFNSASALKTHFKCVHENDEQKCDVCGSTFANKVKLRSHKVRQHSDVRLECPIYGCNYSSPRKLFVRNHIFRHKDIDQFEKDRIWNELKKIKGIKDIQIIKN